LENLKSHKSVEQIARKHRLDVSFIKHQLEMGEPIEHEHTKDHKLAMDIALQHLDEIPDYYTRLKKMEASAKKEHQKFKDVTEGKGLWANINARRKAGKPPKKPGEKGYPKTLDIEEGLKQARKNVGASKCWPGKVATKTKIKDGIEVPDCRSIKEETGMVRYCPKCQKDETRSECKYGPKFWALFSTPSVLTTNQMKYDIAQVHPANEGYDHEYSMARSELSTIISAVKRLQKKINKGEGNIEAWVQSKITKAADYIDTAADYVDSGEMKAESIESGPILPKEKGKRVFPKESEPRATGVKLPKINKESVSIEDAKGNHYAEFIDIIKPEPLKHSKGIGSYMLGEKCWDGYKQKGMKKKGKKMVPNCVPEQKTFESFMIESSAAWQRKEGKNPEGGLNKKGIASYRREHPGSHLSLAVTTKPSELKPGSKSANRRKSFCARMGGMPGPMKDEKGRPTRKALSLRKWNC